MGLPFAFSQGGPSWLSFSITLLMGALCAYTIVLLVKSERKLALGGGEKAELLGGGGGGGGAYQDMDNAGSGDEKPSSILLTLPDVGAAAFPELNFTIAGVQTNGLAIVCHVIIQVIVLGVCVAYMDFIAQTLPSLWPDVFNAGWSILLVTPFFLCTAFLRSFRILAITSIIGDFAVVGAFIAVIAYGFGDSNYGSFEVMNPPLDGSQFLSFLSTATFLFAVHANMLPIAQSMKDAHKKFEPTLYRTFAFIVLINSVFGAVCYSLFQVRGTLRHSPTRSTPDVILGVYRGTPAALPLVPCDRTATAQLGGGG
jgi:hypothetical protein